MVVIKKLSIILPRENAAVDSVISYGRNVKNGMIDNAATFPNADPSMEAFTTALTALENSVPPEDERNTVSINNMQRLKKDFIKLYLAPNANYVLLVANGNRDTARLSGYKLNKEERRPAVQGPITAEFIGPGMEDGTALVRITERGNNDFFVVSLRAGTSMVVLDAFGLLEFTVRGLPSGSSIINIIGKKSDVVGTGIDIVVKAV